MACKIITSTALKGDNFAQESGFLREEAGEGAGRTVHAPRRARSVSGSRGRRPRRTRAAPRSRGAIVHVCGESMAGRCCGCSLAAVALILARTRAPRRTACVCASTMYYTPGDRADGDGCGCGGEAGRAERRMVVISKATESDHGKNLQKQDTNNRNTDIQA